MRHFILKSLRRFFAATHDEEQLRVSEQRLRLLADSARDVVWTMSL